MGLEKLIIKQVVNVAKDTAKMQDAISVMEEKLINEALKVVDKSGINPQFLNFDIVALAKGEAENLSILTPENICSTPPLTSSQKSKAEKQVALLQSSISTLIDNTNKLKEALITVRQPLQTLEVTANSLNTIITSVKIGVKVIKAIPIPVAFGAPAIALPLNVITILSDALDQLDKLLTMGKGIVSIVPKLLAGIVVLISQTIVAIEGLLSKIQPILSILAFVQSKVELGDSCPNITMDQITAIDLAITTQIRDELLASGDSSIPELNIANEEKLLNSLSSNSTDPLIYRGFTLVLEYDPDNEFTFDSRRVGATRNFSTETNKFFTSSEKFAKPLQGNILLYNDPQKLNRYSFSSSAQVLVEEMKYVIDQYVMGLSELITPNDLSRADNDSSGNTGSNIITTNNSGSSGTPTIIPKYTLSGSNIITPLTGNVTGTITTTVNNVSVTMTTFGGTPSSQGSFTSCFLRINQPPKPFQSVESYANELQTITSQPIVLITPGIYQYEMIMLNHYPTLVGSGGNSGNQANFEITAP